MKGSIYIVTTAVSGLVKIGQTGTKFGNKKKV